MKLSWFIARRYLSARRGGRLLSFITWIALGGVTVGVTALIIVIGVMTGMQKDLREKILAANPHLLILEQGSSLRMTDWRTVLDSVRAMPGVTTASPFIFTTVGIKRGEYVQTADLYGVPVDSSMAGGTLLEDRIASGVYDLSPTPSGTPPILMGSGLASRMQIFAGDSIVVLGLENFQFNQFGPSIPIEAFEVSGTFTTGMYDYDTRNVYIPLEEAQALLDLDERDAISGIGAQVEDPDRAEEMARELEDRLGFPYGVQSWVFTNRALFSALRLEKLAMFVILFLIVLVAAFNIVSTLVMVVADRTREIGILKSMGMTDKGILRVFVLQGAWIGIVGTVAGTVLGLVASWVLHTFEIIQIPPEVYFVDRLPVSLEPLDVITIVGASVVIAFAATIYPSLQAARLQPVEAIRYD